MEKILKKNRSELNFIEGISAILPLWKIHWKQQRKKEKKNLKKSFQTICDRFQALSFKIIIIVGRFSVSVCNAVWQTGERNEAKAMEPFQ